MRLLDASALIYNNSAELIDFPDDRSLPIYAVLSHVWAEEEVLFHDIALGPQHEVKVTPTSLQAFRPRTTASPDSWESPDASYTDSDSEYTSSNVDSIATASMDSENFRLPPPEARVKAGWTKVLNTCLQACHDEIQYVWIHTCCIDKSSSAELSEAINSMFRWYQSATVCYVFLADFIICPTPAVLAARKDIQAAKNHIAAIRHKRRYRPLSMDFDLTEKQLQKSRRLASAEEHQSRLLKLAVRRLLNKCMIDQLRHCRWLTRGWTLQELIAPGSLHFFDRQWQHIANKRYILKTLQSITGIHRPALEFGNLDYSIAQRMHWASKRRTTRVEDEAYCLLGIFGISMPLLYGEGSKAFQRLQEEIIKVSTDDLSIFAWELGIGIESDERHRHSLFAPSPGNFWWHASGLVDSQLLRDIYGSNPSNRELHLTNEGMKLCLHLDKIRQSKNFRISVAQYVFTMTRKDTNSRWAFDC